MGKSQLNKRLGLLILALSTSVVFQKIDITFTKVIGSLMKTWYTFFLTGTGKIQAMIQSPFLCIPMGIKPSCFSMVDLLVFNPKNPKSDNAMKRYRLMWMNVPYEAGELKVVAYKNGQQIGTSTMKTADEANTLKLSAESQSIRLDGEDLSFILLEAYDKNGIFCPLADQQVQIEINGPASIAGVGNGNPQSLAPFQADKVKLFYGKAMIILKGKKEGQGDIVVKASSKNLSPTQVIIKGQ